jgi:serine phosphatase RsbU (regulator of sigma subunit)
MKIRTQLIAALFVLAILPLSAIVLFSYVTSLRAVRSAMEEETRALTEEMDGRMASIRDDLTKSFASLGQFPFRSLSGDAEAAAAAQPLLDELILSMGDSARVVQSLEFVPAAPEPPVPRTSEAGTSTPRVADVAELAEIEVSAVDRDGSPAGDADGPAAGRGAVVIHVPRVLAELEAAQRSASTVGEDPADVEAAVGLAVEVLGELAANLDAKERSLEAKLQRAQEAGESVPEAARERMESNLRAQREARAVVTARLHQAIEARRKLSEAERQALDDRRREQRLLFGREFQVPVEEKGEVIGHVTACVAGQDLLAEILRRSTRGEGEVPFAIDRDGNLYAVGEEERAVVEGLGLRKDEGGRWRPAEAGGEWVVGASEDSASGLTFGVARPIRRSLAAVRATAARNFGVGLGLVVLGLVGIQPLSRRMTRHLDAVTRGAERIAKGDLQTRLPVRSSSEFGQLAVAFNRMAEDLSHHQEREMKQRLVQAELERKSLELEEARRFQLSLLPRCLPDLPGLELAVAMTTATEVGGDFYDFCPGDSGANGGAPVLTVAVGDATGHGARAGTMVTVVKSLLIADAGQSGPAEFLGSANRAIRRMELQRMAMALCMARFDGRRLTVASAGMPPVLVHRGGGNGSSGDRMEVEVEEIALPGMPLGGLDETYRESTLELAPGDTVLLMSDGLPELPNRAGDPLGYVAVRDRFARLAGASPEEIIRELEATARAWAGDATPADDMTFVVARVRTA